VFIESPPALRSPEKGRLPHVVVDESKSLVKSLHRILGFAAKCSIPYTKRFKISQFVVRAGMIGDKSRSRRRGNSDRYPGAFTWGAVDDKLAPEQQRPLSHSQDPQRRRS
jgi:hypothetical protein